MTIFVERPCPLCGSRDQTPAMLPDVDPTKLDEQELRNYWTGFRREHVFFTYGRCSSCSMLYSANYFSESSLVGLYGSMNENMAAAGAENTAITQRGYVTIVERYMQKAGDFLEIGPDTGVFAKECAKLNLFQNNAWLFEPNREVWNSLLEIRQLGKTVHLFPRLEDLAGIPHQTIGLAVAVHVIDHLVDPISLLKTIKTKLRPGGILFAVCHNERSLLSRILRRRWPGYCLQHPHLFNQDSLASMLKRAGYTLLEVRRTTNKFSVYFLLDTFLKVVFGVSMPRIFALNKLTVRLPLGNIAAVAKVNS